VARERVSVIPAGSAIADLEDFPAWRRLHRLISLSFRRLPFSSIRISCSWPIDGGPLLWFAVTQNPTAEWLARQFTEAFPLDTAPEYLIRDNDRAFGGRAPHPGVLRLWLALMLAGELTRGSIGTIPATTKIENTQRYREVLWLWIIAAFKHVELL
jgi:hypothetical protein